MVPRPILTHSVFSELSLDAKLLYCVLYNRFSLNLAYGKGDVSYTVCTVQEAASIMSCYRDKAMGLLKELSAFGLIRTEKRHSQLPSKIFVNEFLLKDAEELSQPFALFPAAPAEAPEDQGNKDDAARPENVSPSSAKDEGPDGLKSENGRYGGRKSGETVVGNKEMHYQTFQEVRYTNWSKRQAINLITSLSPGKQSKLQRLLLLEVRY